MDYIQNKYHIIRVGNFATNGNTKILYGLISGLLCMDDYISRNSTDCFTIWVGSTAVWSVVEFCLHMSNTRRINPMYMYIFNEKYQLSKIMGIILQGFQEGGFITTVGLYYGDRLNNANTFREFHLLILFVITTVVNRPNNTELTKISSKRQVNTIGSILFIGSITLYNTFILYQHPEHIQRQLSMFLTMIYFSSYWTFFAWYKGFRTIEVQIKNPKYCLESVIGSSDSLQPYFTKSVNLFDTFCILTYDVLFEIGIAYVFFYNIFLV